MLKSLQFRLLAWLIVPLLFMSFAHFATSYHDIQKNTQKIFDKLLITLAISISEHAISSDGDLLTEDVLEVIKNTTNDELYYKVIGPDNAFIMGYEDIPAPIDEFNILASNVKFYDATFLDRPVRVTAVKTLINNDTYQGWMTTYVAQTLLDREEYMQAFLIDDLYRIAILIIITSVLLSIGVSLALRPLKKVQQSVHNRSPADLQPIKHENLPKEIAGLVAELNGLLERLTAHLAFTKRFVENAAHQLRTPVTALLPQTELALRNAKSDRERIAFDKISKSATKIARLTNQLLNLTYAESISIGQYDFPPIDLADVAKETCYIITDAYPNANITQDIQPAPTFAIAMLIEEVIKNLLGNAIKHAGENVQIILKTEQRDGCAVLSVTDNGKGIPDEFKAKVTERFFRLKSDAKGSGLGLAIVAEIITSHQGKLTITTPSNGQGTCVECIFPNKQ
ncbi:two-component system, OmpR family, sensor histidine kinase TctE [Colwellia chukchiensis]|uniref:histidine kinase n=1 Tax=Colwellia chukchiensis TaxID=641665 RepID=A0A1H7N870_9GAMM|nr:sensor histidine kinase [Colwellia chukchiensis]SEL19481.1 two-component system, OmpR family, sensor histidine kinase TctE [Colwellia chukchiensis]